MSKVYVFLADGFEEIEGLTVVDLLRRAGEEVETVSIMGRKMIEGSHKIKVEADALFEDPGLSLSFSIRFSPRPCCTDHHHQTYGQIDPT